MNWLCAAFLAVSFAGWHYTVVQLTMTTGDWYYDYSFTIVPFIIGALLLVAAGYAFNAIDVLLVDVKAPEGQAAETAPLLDIVTYTASLVSNPTQIDVILDAVRDITSRIQPGQALSAEDQRTLVAVYLRLESYLASSDPLRAFSQSELRKNLTEKFKLPRDDLDALLV